MEPAGTFFCRTSTHSRLWLLSSIHPLWTHHSLPSCNSLFPQAGLVKAAAASGSVSAKARRKRKQQQQAADTSAAGSAAAVAWANRRLQQREYQAAWLAFLRTDLPTDIYKKVGKAAYVGGIQPVQSKSCWQACQHASKNLDTAGRLWLSQTLHRHTSTANTVSRYTVASYVSYFG